MHIHGQDRDKCTPEGRWERIEIGSINWPIVHWIVFKKTVSVEPVSQSPRLQFHDSSNLQEKKQNAPHDDVIFFNLISLSNIVPLCHCLLLLANLTFPTQALGMSVGKVLLYVVPWWCPFGAFVDSMTATSGVVCLAVKKWIQSLLFSNLGAGKWQVNTGTRQAKKFSFGALDLSPSHPPYLTIMSFYDPIDSDRSSKSAK